MGSLYALHIFAGITHFCCYEPVMPDVITDAGHCPLLLDLSWTSQLALPRASKVLASALEVVQAVLYVNTILLSA